MYPLFAFSTPKSVRVKQLRVIMYRAHVSGMCPGLHLLYLNLSLLLGYFLRPSWTFTQASNTDQLTPPTVRTLFGHCLLGLSCLQKQGANCSFILRSIMYCPNQKTSTQASNLNKSASIHLLCLRPQALPVPASQPEFPTYRKVPQ